MADQLKRFGVALIRCALLIPIVVGSVSGVAVSAEPRHIVSGGKDNVLKGYLVRFGAVSAVEVRAPDGAYFESDRGDFGKLARNMRYIVANDCKGLRKITFTGTVDGALWYAGAVSIDREWRLFGIYAPPK